jgi:predicted RNase H-like HicB family nuclease
MIVRRFVVIVEKAAGNFSAYSPDLPGCVATGTTEQETVDNMVQAIHFHLEGCEGKVPSEPKSNVVSAQMVYA